MRKFIVLFTVLCLVCSCMPTTFATEITESTEQSASAVVEYGVDSSYVISIPSVITVGENNYITASDITIAPYHLLEVSITHSGKLTHINDASAKLLYYIEAYGDVRSGYWYDVSEDINVESGEVILTCCAGDSEASVRVYTWLGETPVYAGTYQDIATFSVNIYRPDITFTVILDEVGSTSGESKTFTVPFGSTWADVAGSDSELCSWGLYCYNDADLVQYIGHSIVNSSGVKQYGSTVIDKDTTYWCPTW